MVPLPLPTQYHAAPSGKSVSACFDECLRVEKIKRQVTKSLLLDFDPLLFNRRQEETQPIAESSKEAFGGDVYGVVNIKPKAPDAEPIYDAVAEDEELSEDEDEDEEPPPPPPRQVCFFIGIMVILAEKVKIMQKYKKISCYQFPMAL